MSASTTTQDTTADGRAAATNPLLDTLVETGPATALLPLPESEGRPVRVFGNAAIRRTFDHTTLRQVLNSRTAPGITDAVLNPDAHLGYGAPIGSVLASPTHIYPGPVGVDVKCSMSLLQFDLPAEAIEDRTVRRALINAICERIPTGAGRGQRQARKSRRVHELMGRAAIVSGATKDVLEMLDIPRHWRHRCEDAVHTAHDGTPETLQKRLAWHEAAGTFRSLRGKVEQLGSLGGGNHFAECEVVKTRDTDEARATAEAFGLRDGHVAFLTHCGSRGLGNQLATHQFRTLQKKFEAWGTPFPAGDKHLVYAPLGTPEANDYLDDMALAANFATINHLLINALVLEAFREVLPGVEGELVYFISHNIAREESVDGEPHQVMRKGATRAFPAGHPALRDTPFAETGHPILLPGDPRRGSAVMVGLPGAEASLYSVNHGAGRVLGRRAAIRSLDQQAVDTELAEADVLTNARKYPRDEAPAAYKDFAEVIASVEQAGLARTVADLHARFVIKDSSAADD